MTLRELFPNASDAFLAANGEEAVAAVKARALVKAVENEGRLRVVGRSGYILVTGNLPVLAYVRQTQRTRYGPHAKAVYAQNYNAWKAGFQQALQAELRQRGLAMFPPKTPISFECAVYGLGLRGDTDNYLKALLDACQGVLYVNDKQVSHVVCDRIRSQEQGVQIEVTEWEDREE